MKYFGLLIFVFVSQMNLFSQSTKEFYLGVNGGITYSSIITKNNLFEHYDYKTGFLTGLNFGVKLNSHFNLETNVDFYQNGYSLKYKTNLSTGNFIATNSYAGFKNLITQDYINNSWLTEYVIGNKLEITFQAGLYWSLLTQSKYKYKAYSNIDSQESSQLGIPAGYKEYNKNGFNPDAEFTKVDLGVIGGIGCGYKLNSKFKVLINARYERGLWDYSKQEYFEPIISYNNSFSVSLGLRMKI